MGTKLVYFNKAICEKCQHMEKAEKIISSFFANLPKNHTIYSCCPYLKNLLESEDLACFTWGKKRVDEQVLFEIEEHIKQAKENIKLDPELYLCGKSCSKDHVLSAYNIPHDGCPNFIDHLMYSEAGNIGFRVGYIKED